MKKSRRVKGHTRYKTSDGTVVVGVTTAINLMAKPQLIKWANNLGLEGIDSAKFLDELAEVGTYTHEYVHNFFKGTEMDLEDYSPRVIEKAQRPVKKFHAWLDETGFEVINSELSLVSNHYKYGGTMDIYGMRHGKKTLIDIKTGKSIYGEMFTQVSAYKNLAEENGLEVEDSRILRLGRDDAEGFVDRQIPYIDKHFQRFLLLLNLYNLNKELK